MAYTPPVSTIQTFNASIVVTIVPAIVPAQLTNSIVITIGPEETPSQTVPFLYPINITTLPIEINLSTPITFLARRFIEQALEFYIDEDRELKTLVNYGEDQQSVALAWRPGNTERSIQLKLLQPIPDAIELNATTFLSREVAKTVVDTFRVRFAPPIDETPYLRPKNTNISVNKLVGRSLRNKTFETLRLRSGSTGDQDTAKNISFEDQVFRQWYSDDFNSSELNIDFTSYDNFVFYSSAYLRLHAFRQKLRQIERIDQQRIQFISGSVFTGSLAFAGATYIQEQGAVLAKEKENIIRGFDRQEQYLYFTPSGSVSAYSASFDYVDGGVEYNPIGYWPKSGSMLWPVDSSVATDWFTTQSAIAQRFDEFNENNLLNTIPTHVREHVDNGAYITFVSMIGHFFDTIKPYIDQFTDIYSRYSNPDEELSKDLVVPVAESFGFTLPAIDSLQALENTFITLASVPSRRDYTIQTYKRLLHNLPLFSKAKGTKTAINVMLRSLGFSPSVVSIKETGTPTSDPAIELYSESEEYTTGIKFTGAAAQYITIPLASTARNPQTLQLNTLLSPVINETILTADTAWGVYVTRNTENLQLGRLELISSSLEVLMTSSYHPMFEGDVNISITRDGADATLRIIKTDGPDVLFDETTTIPQFASIWDVTNELYIGGSGSLKNNGFTGTLDEVRLWNVPLPSATVLSHAFDPGTLVGNTFKSPAENLLVRLSFDMVNEILLTSQSALLNETPYFARFDSPSLELIDVNGFTTSSFIRYERTIKQQTPVVGALEVVSNKIKVLPPPVFDRWAKTSNGVSTLSRTKSIVLTKTKQDRAGKNLVTLSFSPTSAINTNIIRTVGTTNINRLLGLPRRTSRVFERTLRELNTYYDLFYRNKVNYNTYIRTVSNIAAVINQMIDYFIPARVNLLSGVVIEPTILERTVVSLEKNIRVYGKRTRKTDNAAQSLRTRRADYGATFNLDKTIPVVLQENISGSNATISTRLEDPIISHIEGTTSTLHAQVDSLQQRINALTQQLSTTIDEHDTTDILATPHTYTSTVQDPGLTELVGQNSTQTTTIVLTEPLNITSSIGSLTSTISTDTIYQSTVQSNYIVYANQHESWETYTSEHSNTPKRPATINLELEKINKIGFSATNKGKPGAEPYNRVYTRKLFDTEINFPRPGGITSLNPNALYEIKPIADFTDPGVITFFSNTEGIYTFPQTELRPTYPNEIDFTAATTWSYGARYMLGDVVYQDVQKTDEATLGSRVKTARGGNGRFYVFKTRSAAGPPEDGTRYISGSIPSYTPPSLDEIKWDTLRFTPIERRVPRRVVFDTFITKNPVLNNFKTTTIDFRQRIDIPSRYVDTFTLPTLSQNGQALGDLVIQNIFSLFALQASTSNLRVRIYRTEQSRNNDVLRTSTTLPTGSHGVLLDVILTATEALILTNPIPTLVADSVPPAGRVYYTLDNLDPITKSNISLTMYYYALQIEPRVPRGHLQKHYRFFRTNSTGTKRHSYLGCKNTVETTVDGRQPVEIFIGEGNVLKVAPTRLIDEIITGGGGTLDVT